MFLGLSNSIYEIFLIQAIGLIGFYLFDSLYKKYQRYSVVRKRQINDFLNNIQLKLEKQTDGNASIKIEFNQDVTLTLDFAHPREFKEDYKTKFNLRRAMILRAVIFLYLTLMGSTFLLAGLYLFLIIELAIINGIYFLGNIGLLVVGVVYIIDSCIFFGLGYDDALNKGKRSFKSSKWRKSKTSLVVFAIYSLIPFLALGLLCLIANLTILKFFH